MKDAYLMGVLKVLIPNYILFIEFFCENIVPIGSRFLGTQSF